MAMARPGGIHGVMEVKKEDHWAGEDSLNHSAGRCFLLYLSIPLPFENVRPVDFSVLSLLNCMVELGRVPSHIKRIVSGLSAINQIRC